jgi:imidazolonepropionase-like amidohydrolase
MARRKKRTMKGGPQTLPRMTIKGRTSTGRMPSTKTHPRAATARFPDVKKPKKLSRKVAMGELPGGMADRAKKKAVREAKLSQARKNLATAERRVRSIGKISPSKMKRRKKR